jgi:hypothetical protein
MENGIDSDIGSRAFVFDPQFKDFVPFLVFSQGFEFGKILPQISPVGFGAVNAFDHPEQHGSIRLPVQGHGTQSGGIYLVQLEQKVRV